VVGTPVLLGSVESPQATLTSPGQTIAGTLAEVTVTWNVHVALFPLASVAVQLTVVVPTGKVPPEGGALVTVGFASAMSVAVAGG
jgi:hypothetical protein